MSIRRGCFLGIACWSLAGPGLAQGTAPASGQCPVQILDVVSSPQRYQAKRIRVQGMLDLRLEEDSIRHGRARLSLNLFRPVSDDTSKAALARMNARIDEDWRRIKAWRRAGLEGTWVEVTGTFDADETGHLGMIKDGGLRDVTTIVAYKRGSTPTSCTDPAAD